MIICQLSMFLENKPGRLCDAIDVLAKNNINISALSLADSEEYGVLRLIVDQPELAKQLLTESGIVVNTNHVHAIAMDDAPGGASGILRLFNDNGISVEYMYACVGKTSGKALMVVRTDSGSCVEQILRDNGYEDVSPSDIYRI